MSGTGYRMNPLWDGGDDWLVILRSVLFETQDIMGSVKIGDQVTTEQVSPFEYFQFRHTSRVGFTAAK